MAATIAAAPRAFPVYASAHDGPLVNDANSSPSAAAVPCLPTRELRLLVVLASPVYIAPPLAHESFQHVPVQSRREWHSGHNCRYKILIIFNSKNPALLTPPLLMHCAPNAPANNPINMRLMVTRLKCVFYNNKNKSNVRAIYHCYIYRKH